MSTWLLWSGISLLLVSNLRSWCIRKLPVCFALAVYCIRGNSYVLDVLSVLVCLYYFVQIIVKLERAERTLLRRFFCWQKWTQRVGLIFGQPSGGTVMHESIRVHSKVFSSQGIVRRQSVWLWADCYLFIRLILPHLSFLCLRVV